MTDYDPAGIESTDLEPRTRRALTECMTVLPDGGDIYTVVGQNGSTYRVDGREGRCTCPDHKNRSVRCKHIRRVAFATGTQPIPAGVEADDLLGAQTDETPRVAATDGGIIDAGDEGAILDESDDGRPDDCDCGDWNTGLELPCWPCYWDGFDEPA